MPTPSLSTGKADAKRVRKRRQLASMFLLQGFSPKQITERVQEMGMHCSYPTICADLRWLDKQWQKEAMYSAELVKRRIAEALGQHRSESWMAWERSQHDEVITTTKTFMDENGEPIEEVQVRRKPQVGDARFLAEVRENLRQLATLTGLDQMTVHADGDLTGGYGADVARALEQIAENTAAMGGSGGGGKIPIVDGDVIEAHVLGAGGNGSPAIEHDKPQKGEENGDESNQGADGAGDAPEPA